MHSVITKGLFNGKFAKPNQKEVIFDKSTKFKMVDYFEKDGVFYFEMVEL